VDNLPQGPELERLLESIEQAMYVDLYDALPPAMAQEYGVEAWRGDGLLRITTRALDHPMMNRVMGVGLQRPAEAQLIELAAHYAAAGIRRWMLQVPPHAETPAFRAACAERGIIKLRGWAKHIGPATLTPAARSDLPIQPVGAERAEEWAAVVGETFAMPPAFHPWMARLAGREAWRLFGAFEGETLVAAAALYLHGEIGELTWAGTREGWRGRGAQSALIAARFEAAREAGVKWLVTETDEELPDRPNPSYHNMVRLGLPVRYVRANWGPPKPADA
jgi:GNAT superfamily N-acetyltransferase